MSQLQLLSRLSLRFPYYGLLVAKSEHYINGLHKDLVKASPWDPGPKYSLQKVQWRKQDRYQIIWYPYRDGWIWFIYRTSDDRYIAAGILHFNAFTQDRARFQRYNQLSELDVWRRKRAHFTFLCICRLHAKLWLPKEIIGMVLDIA